MRRSLMCSILISGTISASCALVSLEQGAASGSGLGRVEGQTESTRPPSISGSQARATATLHARSDLVVLDVVVKDAKQNPVRGLHSSDFTLLEDGIPQQATSFEEHSSPPAGEERVAPLVMPPATFGNYTPAPEHGPMNVLLLDALNTSMSSQEYVREQLLEYLKQAQPGTRIAIFGLTRRLVLLQGLTSDMSVLKAAMLAKGDATASDLLQDPSDTITDFMGSTISNDPMAAQMIANVRQFEADRNSYELQMRQRYTLTAMDQLALYLAGIPGRKNLIWFSGSFPLSILPNFDLTNPFSVVAGVEDEYRETATLLARSQVAVYPIDARGVVSSPIHAASNPQKKYASSPHSFARDEAQFHEDLFAEHGTMSQMAQDTGGQAFMDINGLAAAVAQAIESGSNYYTLTYAPGNKNWDGHYRKIGVDVQRPDVTLAYRRGYYANNPAVSHKPDIKQVEANTLGPDSPISLALMRGAPTPTEILMKVRILPASTVTEKGVAEGNELNPAAKIGGPFRRYVMDFRIDPGAVDFSRIGDGSYACSVEFVTIVYDRDGIPVVQAGRTAHALLTREKLEAVMRTGVPFHQEISVPAKGEFYLRSAAHDLSSGRVGALEVPVAAVSRFPPHAATISSSNAAGSDR